MAVSLAGTINRVHLSHCHPQNRASARRAPMSERRSWGRETGVCGGNAAAMFQGLDRVVRRDGRGRLHVEGNLDLKDKDSDEELGLINDVREPLVEDGTHPAVLI